MVIGVVLGVVVLGVGGLWTFQRSLVYFPDRSPPPPADEVLPGARDVTLATSDGLDLGAYYLPARAGCSGTVLVAQGNGGNRAGRVGLGAALGNLGFGVLLFDYRGYAGNPGRPTEDGLARDARAALGFLTAGAGIPPDRIVYFGESLGAAVVARLSTEHPPAGMLLRSPFTSLADVGRAAYGLPVGWLLRDRYDVTEAAGQVRAPTAVVYGSADGIVPASQSRAVARAARDAGTDVVEFDVAGADHNDAALATGPEVLAALLEVARRGGITGCG